MAADRLLTLVSVLALLVASFHPSHGLPMSPSFSSPCRDLCAAAGDVNHTGTEDTAVDSPAVRNCVEACHEAASLKMQADAATAAAENRKEEDLVRVARGGGKDSKYVRIGRGGWGGGDPDSFHDDSTSASFYNYRRPHYLRIGRSTLKSTAMEKRAAPATRYLRIGRANYAQPFEIAAATEKRGPSSRYVRIGRAGSLADDLNEMVGLKEEWEAAQKRSPSSRYVRIGRSSFNKEGVAELGDAIDKRVPSSRYLRIGRSGLVDDDDEAMASENDKRTSRYVRIGRSGLVDDDDAGMTSSDPDKRASRYVRIGRAHLADAADDDEGFDSDKRASRYVRIGRGFADDDDKILASEAAAAAEKRASRYVRIGRGYEELMGGSE